MLISRINWRISSGTAGRPGRRLDFQRQYDRKPARCQRITVSGRMMASASRAFGNNPQTQPRTNLSLAVNGNRPTLPRRSTMICCRSTRISASSVARDRNRSKTRPKISLMRPNIRPSVARFCAPCQPDSIYDRDRYPRPAKDQYYSGILLRRAAVHSKGPVRSERLTAPPVIDKTDGRACRISRVVEPSTGR